MDYLSAHINNQACALAVELGLGVEVPERAKVIRTILAELTRLASHALWWGCMGLDLGAVTPFFYAFREREMINDIMEESCGARLTQNFIVPGGLMADVHPNFVQKTKDLVKLFRHNILDYNKLLTGNVIFRERTQAVGMLSKEDAISWGTSGPVARASGVSCDVRKYFPYDAYDRVQFKEIVSEGCDSWARYLVRIEEMQQSFDIIDQLIDNIPEGDFVAKTKAVIKLPKGEFYSKVETARGELGVLLVSDGGSTPYRVKFRSPNFSNLSALGHMAKGAKLGDLVAMMATLDLVIPDVDR
jgi:NADH-quinone oxidoreductase subunit D/NADH-quinone oxidoreductase subunit C/D